MSGPADRQPFSTVVPPGEAQKLYTPAQLAWRVQNFVLHPDGYLAAIRGPCPYEPNRGAGYPVLDGRPAGIFHAGLLGGIADTLLLRAGRALYRHAGWTRGWEQLRDTDGAVIDDLDPDLRPRWPDQWLVLGDRVIWTNGQDRARVISADGMVVPLGFDSTPGAPMALGPSLTNQEDRYRSYPNGSGYSWPGRIGSVGDTISSASGWILHGEWTYRIQWEDVHGNLSAMSAPSAPAVIYQQAVGLRESDYRDMPEELDDLTRQFFVRLAGSAPPHAVATRVYRTKDIPRNGPASYLLARIPGAAVGIYPDKRSDSELVGEATETISVPVFRTMTAHQGSLVIGNEVGDAGIVRKSEPGFPGTIHRNSWIYPDSGGAEVTGLASHEGRLLAFTELSTYDISDFRNPVAIARGVGCVAPRSIQALPDGTLIWLGRDAFYGMQGGALSILSGPIYRTVRWDINHARERLAVSSVDPKTGEYRCVVCPAGRDSQTLWLCFDGIVWRRLDMSITADDVCVTDDWRRMQIFAGRDIAAGINGAWVMGREVATYTPPARTYRYRSGWIRASETGLEPVNVHAIYVGMVDGANADGTMEFYGDGSWAPRNTQTDLRLVGVDQDSRVVTDIANAAVIGTSRLHARRLRWRWVSAGNGLQNVHTWAFEIRSTSVMNLAAFAFDVSFATKGSPRGRIPRQADV